MKSLFHKTHKFTVAAFFVLIATVSFAQPANDNCANAIALNNIGTACVNGDNTLATVESFEAGTGAAGLGCWATAPDNTVWYTFTPPATANYTIGTASTNADTQLKLLSGTCGSFTSVACSEDAVGLAAEVTAPLTVGVTYYVQIDFFDLPGAFCVDIDSTTIATPPPGSVSNDCPYGAIDITPEINLIDPLTNPFDCYPQTYASGTSTPTATQVVGGDGVACDVNNTDYRDRWFRFTVTATTPDVWIDVYGGIDYVSALYSGTPSGPCGGPISGLSYIDCSDGVDPGGARDKGAGTTPVRPRISCNGLAPGTYWYRVWEWGGGAPALDNFRLCIEAGAPIGVTSDRCPDNPNIGITCGQPNTDVNETYALHSNAGTEGNASNTVVNEPQVAAGASGDLREPCGVGNWLTTLAYANNVINNTAIYAFDINTVGCDAIVKITFDNMDYGGIPGNVAQMQVMNNVCGGGTSATMTATTDQACLEMRPGLNSPLPNGRYYIVVDGQDGQLIQYDLSLEITHQGAGCLTSSTQPEQPIGMGATRCGPGTVTLSATGCSGGTLNWYSQPDGGTSLGTGGSFTTPSISVSTPFYVGCTIGSCEGPRTLVYATVQQGSTLTNTTPTTTCDASNANYVVTFDVNGGNGSGFNFTENSPGVGGQFNGITFTSNPIPTGATFDYDITESSGGCGAPLNVTGLVNCLCLSDAGAMDQTEIVTCGNGSATATHDATNMFKDNNDTLGFVLHDNNSNILGTLLGTNNNPVFSFNTGTMTYGTLYYISAIVGDDDGTGQVDLNDPCLSVAPGTPCRWYAKPITQASAIDPDVCEGEDIQLQATTFGNSSYTWVGPNAYSSSQQNPTITNSTLNMGGTYTVTALENGCQSSSSVEITVSPTPNAQIAAQPSGPFCEDGVIETFTGSPAGGTWSGNGITDQNAGTWDPSLAGTGTHTISYSVPGGQCPAVGTRDIVVNATPNVVFNAVPTSGCSPLNVRFYNGTLNTNSVIWDFGDGQTNNAASSVDSVDHTYQGGTYDVSLTVEANGCSNSTTLTNYINVTQTPAASFNSVNTDGGQFVFENTSTGGQIFNWDFGTGDVSSDESPNYDYGDQTGSFTVTLVASTPSGCSRSISSVITIEEDLIFFVPNAFTPNADQNNNYFEPVMTSGFEADSYEFTVFNRWGELVFQSNDIEVGWDGTYQNRVAPTGIYTWIITFTDAVTDKKYRYDGSMNLLR